MRPNVFAGPHVDRLKFANADAESVARAIAEGSARLIPVWKSRCPVVRLPTPAACLLPFECGPFAGIDIREMILLGDYRGLAIFTTEIESADPPPLPDGAEFADLRHAAALLPHDEAGLVAYARAMISFRHRHRLLRKLRCTDRAPEQRSRDDLHARGLRHGVFSPRRSRHHRSRDRRRPRAARPSAGLARRTLFDDRRIRRAGRKPRGCGAPRGARGNRHRDRRNDLPVLAALAFPALADARIPRRGADRPRSGSATANSRTRAGSTATNSRPAR